MSLLAFHPDTVSDCPGIRFLFWFKKSASPSLALPALRHVRFIRGAWYIMACLLPVQKPCMSKRVLPEIDTSIPDQKHLSRKKSLFPEKNFAWQTPLNHSENHTLCFSDKNLLIIFSNGMFFAIPFSKRRAFPCHPFPALEIQTMSTS